MRRPLPSAIGPVLAAVLVVGCASSAAPSSSPGTPPATAATTAPAPATTAATSPAPSTTAAASGPLAVHVAPCPVPAADFAGTPYSPRPAPATMSLPVSVPLSAGAQIFGAEFLPGPASYLLGPKSATCHAVLAGADDGESMTAAPAAGRSEGVTMVIRAGGAGPSTDLACPYIPAVYAADKAFRQGHTFCAHPAADVIRQIPTGTASLYAAAVLVPAQVKDPNLPGSGDGTDPTVALYTARASSDGAVGQMISCTLAPAQGAICAASLGFFLATQAQISTTISAGNLARMQAALAAFLAGHGIR